MCNMVLNQELNGVELYFDGKPEQEILSNLKSSGFRWSGKKFCWYAKQNEKTLSIAHELTGEIKADQITDSTNQTAPITKTTKPQNKSISLWDLTQWTELEVNSKQPVKEIAAEVRKHVKARFPMVKFSVTSSHSSINFYITASPYGKDSIYIEAVKDYCTNLLKAYNYCTCYDPYGDYGSSHNFYGAYAKIDYEYIQTEQTEAIKADIEDFNTKQAEHEIQEEERKEQEHQEYLKLQEVQKESDRIAREESARQIVIINNSVEVKPLDKTEQYFIIGSQFAKCNKNQTLGQYKEEITEGEDNYSLETVKIQKEIHFSTQEALDYFGGHLLTYFDFLEQTGGSFIDDPRINTMTDYQNMDKEERETVIFNLCGVAVYYNSELQFIIDTQGFSYARYVGLVDNITIEKTITASTIYTEEELQDLKEQAETLADLSLEAITCDRNIINTWNNEDFPEYKTRMKQIFNKNYWKPTKAIIQQIPAELEELKVAMYRILKEVDGIQEQFQNADLQQGQKVTLIYMSDWGGMVTSQITFDHFECCKYAQYDKAVKIIFKQPKKHGMYSITKYDELLVYPDWLNIPTEVLHTVEQTGTCTITSGKFLSCDHRQYDAILNHFTQQGITPLINTYKPIF